MTAPLTDVQRGLAAISSIAILAGSLPTAEVRAALERQRTDAAQDDPASRGAEMVSLGLLIDIVDAVAFLGRLGGDLEQAAEANRGGRG